MSEVSTNNSTSISSSNGVDEREVTAMDAITPMDLDSKGQMTEMKGEYADVDAAIRKMQQSNKPDIAKHSLRTVLKMLKVIQKKPSDKKSRMFREDNIIIKKHITGVAGATMFMNSLGFESKEVEDKVYLMLEDASLNVPILDHAIKMMEDAVSEVENTITTPPPEKPKVKCKAGCGFWGDPQMDELCSQCHKKMYVDVPNKSPALKPNSNASPALKPIAAPVRQKCVKDCGFFGSPAFDNMCSKCFTLAGGKINPAEVGVNKSKHWKKKLKSAFIKVKAMIYLNQGKRPPQEHKDRCWKCSRKLGLSGIECRCGYIFCGKHRYADEHECKYDHQARQRAKLAKDNQKIEAKKMERIEDEN